MTKFFGALPSKYDVRDYRYKGSGVLREYDSGELVTKDQNGSYSCGGQAWAYYGEVLERIATQSDEPRSAKWIYSHTNEKGGGSYGRTNCDFVIKQGWVRESLVSSYDHGKPPAESFMIEPVPVTSDIQADAEVDKALSYLHVNPTFVDIANAVYENNGCVILISGQDNGTWRSKFPHPPTQEEWRHFLYVGKVKKIENVWYIGVKNSWGDVGENGWQYLSAEYINNWCIEGWTLAWDYTPAKHKLMLQALVKMYTQLAAFYQKLLNKK